ncbi:MAG: cytochrome c [Actinomycetota bacterium]|nr:cytochrome c [Actinomycetota bacterium]
MKRLLAIMTALVMVLAACGGGDSDNGDDGGSDNGDSSGLVGDAAAGEDVYASTCATCHGPDATGIDGLGKDLHNNAFVDGLNDAELVAFLEEGRSAGDPANETGVDMPPKGGNPSLSDQDLYDVSAYLRTLD